MNIYILLYLLVAFLLNYVGYKFYKKYNNISGLGFFLFNVFISVWFILYFLTYYGTSDLNLLLYISRFTYAFSLAAIYSFLLFIKYFDRISKNIKISFITKIFYFIIGIFGLIVAFTPFVIESLYYNDDKLDYYEKTGILFNIYLLLEIIFIPRFLYLVFKKYNSLFYINKLRFKYILLGAFLFIILGLIFQLILPIFGIYIFEKEVILFIIPFLFFSWYSITRYHFTDLSIRYKEIYSFILSILLTIFIFYIIKEFSLNLPENFLEYWGINKNFTYIDLVIGIILYILFYNFFIFILPGNTEYQKFVNILNKWKENIPFITNIYDLNRYLLKEAKLRFSIKHLKVILYKKTDFDTELYKYFSNNLKNDLFINDIVFIEENKNKLDLDKIIENIDNKVYIIFPIFDSNNNLLGIFEIGKKPFKENFYTEEIKIIKEFVNFLIGHIRYMEIYAEINYLNLNLDKKVDDKTMEYNNLINKQKEFISMASHEIKTPVTASYMQIESIIDDIESGEYDKVYLDEELGLLKEQIFKVADLVKNIFTVQKYDIKDIGLYIEKIKLKNLVIGEYDILHRLYPNIDFDISVPESIGFIEIDKIQFIQVISNLLNNAIKFLNNENPIIKISVRSVGDNIEMKIEDNGPGFKHGDEKIIFEKYATGKGKSVGIGMGLYLCKKIVELHGGKILAKRSKILGGACFKIVIPKFNKM